MNCKKSCKLNVLLVLFLFINFNISFARDSWVVDNISYNLPSKGDLTEEIVKNLSYNIHLYGAMFDNSYKENPPFTLTKFDNGTSKQNGEIKLINFGKLSGLEKKSAVVYFTIFDGGNNSEHYIAVITQDGNKYNIKQAVLDYAKMGVEKIEIKNDKILIHILSHGPNDAGCCPSVKEKVVLKIENEKLKLIQQLKK
mgnify:CR=1 FL=1